MSFFSLDIYTIIARIIIILLILPIHEFAHAYVARKCGDRTAEYSGRLTFHPLSHVDPVGAILLLLTGFGWAKPVPIDPRQMRDPRKGIIWTSLAGPLSNLLVAFAAVILFRFLAWIPVTSEFFYNGLSALSLVLTYFISINIGLALFNLIPVPPLDGSKVLMQFLPYRAIAWIQRNQSIISIVFFVMICTHVLNTPLSYLGNWCLRFFLFVTDWIDLLMQQLVG